jgi:hypothetical protein
VLSPKARNSNRSDFGQRHGPAEAEGTYYVGGPHFLAIDEHALHAHEVDYTGESSQGRGEGDQSDDDPLEGCGLNAREDHREWKHCEGTCYDERSQAADPMG